MKRYLQLARGRRGLSLIELLLAAAITVIIIGAAATALILGARMFGATTQTAQEQREIKLVESALKDTLQTALIVRFRTDRPDESETGKFRYFLFFDGADFVMQMGNTEIRTGNIQKINIELQTNNKVSYAKYEIITDHVTYHGVVVMNNLPVEEVDALPYRTATLSPGSGSVFCMEVPDPEDPFNVKVD